MAHRILIVDDEAPTRELLSLMLRKHAFTPSGATSGAEALAIVREQSFDLIILDLVLEDADGIDLIAPILAQRPGTPIILFSGANPPPETIEKARQLGASSFLSKEQPLDQMLAEIRRLLP